MGAVVTVEPVEVVDVLEVVGVQIAVFQSLVGLDVIGVLHDLQLDALLGQNGLALLQDLGVGGDAGAHLQRGGLRSGSVAAVGGITGRRGVRAAAAGQQGQHQQGAEGQGEKLLHVQYSFSKNDGVRG